LKEEKRSIQITFRVTPQEYARLKSDAGKKEQSVSQYVVDRVFGEENRVPKTRLREIYFNLAKIQDAVQTKEGSTMEAIVQKECDEIWHILKW